jgi:hypothetical protein
MEYLGAWGTLIHEKNLKSKISCQTPFKNKYRSEYSMWPKPQRVKFPFGQWELLKSRLEAKFTHKNPIVLWSLFLHVV